ncbi:TPA: OmpA family protein [Vibrio parahaemolyticus]
MNTIKKACLFAATFLLFACSNKGSLLVGEEPMSTKFRTKDNESVSQVVFLHAGSIDNHSGAMVIFSNGVVVAGLQPSQHVVLPICNGNQSFQVMRGGKRLEGEAININVSSNSTQYIKLLPYSTPSGIRYEQSKISSLNEIFIDSNSKSFLAPRYNLNCQVDKPIEFNLSSESFFEFGGSQLIDVVQSDELQKIVDFINSYEGKNLKVTVSGYTDHLGERDFNQKLSEERAQTVADYIVSRGYDGPIYAFGFGPSEPVVECSSSLNRSELIQCLQPNRRVTVRIWTSK